MTREEWLLALTTALRPHFAAVGYSLPAAIRVSCGWPSSRALATPSSKSRVIGQCWPAACSEDATREIFVSPSVADAAAVAAILVHELVHAALNTPGHKAPFRRAALAVGLAGKMTATHAGPELAERLNALTLQIGPYPHAVLDLSQQPKQSTRMVKLTCPGCTYTIRTTRKWIEAGLPICPCGEPFEE
jgi:hypothetical protein